MPSECFQVVQKLEFATGIVVVHPLELYTERVEAMKVAQSRSAQLQAMGNYHMFQPAPGGGWKPTGLMTQRFMGAMLGITKAGYDVGEAKMHDGPEIVKPKSNLIIPGRR